MRRCNFRLFVLFLRIDAIAGEGIPLQLKSRYLKIALLQKEDERRLLVLFFKLWMHPQKFILFVRHPHKAAKAGVFLFKQSLKFTKD